MTTFWMAVSAALALGAITAGAVGGLRWLLVRHGVFDAPTVRSSHHGPKPRGAGLALIPLVSAAWVLGGIYTGLTGQIALVASLAAGLCLVSFVDDVWGLSAGPRLGAQAGAVIVVLGFADPGPVFQGLLPLWADRLVAGLAWLWFVNLFNFMDGIDGLTGVQTVWIGLGLLLVGWIAGDPGAAMLPALWLVAGAAGFLVWNRPPARIFLGDSGSVPLGFLVGWLLLDAAGRGHWSIALILPGYYWADATLTLLRRLFRGAKIWHAHREHAYQRAVQGGLSHATVTGLIGATAAGLSALAALAATGAQFWALGMAVLLVSVTLLGLERVAARRPAGR